MVGKAWEAGKNFNNFGDPLFVKYLIENYG